MSQQAPRLGTGLSSAELAILALEATCPPCDKGARGRLADALFGPGSQCPARSRPMIRYWQVVAALRDRPEAEVYAPAVVARLRASATHGTALTRARRSAPARRRGAR